ncbi:hypothetical protein ANME2D_00651 [Candidatus Methanoperedens nitroreducens]|uniref:Uncharacterized protein n=2 Tax=Candidatus Methanoperedens nitratireducens TaxID=1392998 RepID=A0A062VEF6_9EURY|nr:hypothetical protein ANME2D_00651 [Candidatus Methanoperedens nitroreducens]
MAMIIILVSAQTVYAITAIQNTAPSASRYDPNSSSLTLAAGQARTFIVKGTDPDGNLRGTEWYLSGKHQSSRFALSGPGGTDSWSYTFNTSGMYAIEALVFDTQNAYSSPALWTVQVDSASIASFNPPTGTKYPGNTLSSSVTVKNTGRNTRSYWVGLSYRKPDGTLYNIPAKQTNTLSPNSQQTLNFSWNLPPDAPYGSYNAITSIWNGYNSNTSLMKSPKYGSKNIKDAFTVVSGNPKQMRALFIWGAASTVLDRSQEADSLIQYSKEHGINTLFFYTDISRLSNSPSQFKSFIARAHSNNISVHALNGEPAWTTDHQTATNYVKAVINYNKNSRTNERFDGVCLDVESYVLKSWEKDSNGDSLPLAKSSVNSNLAAQYLKLLSGIKNTISSSGTAVTFGVDIPFWFDGNGFELTYNKSNRLLSSHVQDITDITTIMDYTDNYNNAIAWARYEIDYATRINKSAVIAFETQKLDNPGSTFYEEGAAALENAIKQVNSSFSSKQGFRGVAIHSYESYKYE